MHVHELNPKRTSITLVLFAAVIVFGLITIAKPRLEYGQTPEQTVEMVVWEEGVVFPYDLVDLLNGTVDTVLLIDLRNTFEYGRGNIPGSENITSVELLKEENINRLEQLKKDGFRVVVYADDQLGANGPWMVLRQLGFDNVSILYGGYKYYQKWKNQLADSYADDGYLKGGADFDYAKIASNANVATDGGADNKASVSFKRKKKSSVAEGGC